MLEVPDLLYQAQEVAGQQSGALPTLECGHLRCAGDQLRAWCLEGDTTLHRPLLFVENGVLNGHFRLLDGLRNRQFGCDAVSSNLDGEGAWGRESPVSWRNRLWLQQFNLRILFFLRRRNLGATKHGVERLSIRFLAVACRRNDDVLLALLANGR